MKTRRYLKIEMAQIRTLISDIDRTLQILQSDIETEEERARVSDRSDPTYPMLARQMAMRRDNLKRTIAALEDQLFELSASGQLDVAA